MDASPEPYVSRCHIIRRAGPDRDVVLPTGESVTFGVHGDIARHYGIPVEQGAGHAATLDYVVAAIASAMVGTFARTLREEGIILGAGDVEAEAQGIFRSDEGELVLAALEVSYELRVPRSVDGDVLERAHDRHVPMCPLVRTFGRCIEIRTSYSVTSSDASST